MRSALRAILILAVLAFGAFLLFGHRPGWPAHSTAVGARVPPVGTSGALDLQKAREQGAELGEKTAVATAKVQEAVAEAAITAKIKTKMALDDAVKARAIDVSTSGSTVTVSGTVRSAAERNRAIALARETNGVTRVIDALRLKP